MWPASRAPRLFLDKLPCSQQAHRMAGEAVLSWRPMRPDQGGKCARDPF